MNAIKIKFIKNLRELGRKDISIAGGKGAHLGEMLRANFPIPPGFVVTTRAYSHFYNKDLPVNFKEEIFKAFDNLRTERVAVRSSAIAEDSSTASWAGQLKSYLNVDKKDLIGKIRECWKSIKSARAIQYAAEQNIPQDKLLVAVIVQKMIVSEISGVIFTINPITNNRNEIMIEAGYGLGEMIAQGLITPNNFILDKKALQIKSKDVQTQETMLIFKNGKNREVAVAKNKKNRQVISDNLIKKLGEIAIRIEKHCQIPQDIEWAIDKTQKIWILQSRPVTTV